MVNVGIGWKEIELVEKEKRVMVEPLSTHTLSPRDVWNECQHLQCPGASKNYRRPTTTCTHGPHLLVFRTASSLPPYTTTAASSSSSFYSLFSSKRLNRPPPHIIPSAVTSLLRVSFFSSLPPPRALPTRTLSYLHLFLIRCFLPSCAFLTLGGWCQSQRLILPNILAQHPHDDPVNKLNKLHN